jgi:hypothetical protein
MKLSGVLDTIESKYLANRGLCNIAFFAILILYFVVKKIAIKIKNKKQNIEYDALIKERQAVCEKSFEKSFDVDSLIKPDVQK